MRCHPVVLLVVVAMTVLLAGCADMAGGPAHVVIDRARIVDRSPGARLRATVEVVDIRREARMERTALGASLGAITLDPPETELVRAVVQARADDVIARLGIVDPQAVLCGIRVFDISTPSTPLYWDIETEIEVVLRVHGQDRTVSVSASDRTFVWPSERLMADVVVEVLNTLGTESERALEILLARP